MAALNIVYEDDHLVIVNKAAGMLTVADRFQQESVHLQSLLRKKYGEIYTIHRLDKDTSGLVVFAKNAECHRAMSLAFEERDVNKVYLALADGNLPDEGTIDEPLALSDTRPGTMKVYKKGKPSLTTFRTLRRFEWFSELEVTIHTGRMHQIRVHLAYIGHPLFIDPLYGRRAEFFLSEWKGRKYKAGKFSGEERPLCSRLTLHAWKLDFTHPVTGEKMHFEAEVPKDIKALTQQAKVAV